MSKTISAEDFDRLVDENKEDVVQYFDLDNARRGGAETKRINIDVPIEVLADLDREAARRGITRQSLIKVWLYERLHSDSVIFRGESAWGPVTPAISSLYESVIDLLKNKG